MKPEINELIKRFPWMDKLMAETLIKLEDEGKLQPLLETMANDPYPIWNVTSKDIFPASEKNNDDGKETPCEGKSPN
tara:strand:+ start:188 stop:418 length:231 start_codon:yes stop_codon:yes gene_type:complete